MTSEIDKNLAATAMAIRSPLSLEGLLGVLRAFESIADRDGNLEIAGFEELLLSHGVDMTALPTLGGAEPADTDCVWSWDHDELLVGRGFCRDWKVVPRSTPRSEWKI